MKLRHLYLFFALVGLVLPYSQFILWIADHHALNMALFIHDLFANRISAFFAMDVIVSAIVLVIFIQVEGQRLGMRWRWFPVAGTLLVGVSFGLPLFLYLREVHRDENRA